MDKKKLNDFLKEIGLEKEDLESNKDKIDNFVNEVNTKVNVNSYYIAKMLVEENNLIKLDNLIYGYNDRCYQCLTNTEIENLIHFEKTMTLPLYDDNKDFSETYPFVAYQFNLLQKVFEKVRNMGHSGQHMSRGERSLLSSFQEAGIKVKDKNIGILVPFNYFYESIEQFLEDNVRRPFIHARNEKGIDDFGLEVLKLLFLLKGINGIEPTLNNLTSFMVNSMDCDRIELEKKIKKALEKLEPYLDNNAKAIIKEPEIAIGGSKTKEDSKDIKYGGKVKITFKDPDKAKIQALNESLIKFNQFFKNYTRYSYLIIF